MVSLIGVAGCDSKKDKANDEAAKAQKNADDKAAEATKAQREADDKAAAAKATADNEVVKTHNDARDKLQKVYDDSDRKVAALREKVSRATGTRRKNADAAAAEVATRQATVKADLSNLTGATGTAWDTTKTQVEADQAALDKATDNLETALK